MCACAVARSGDADDEETFPPNVDGLAVGAGTLAGLPFEDELFAGGALVGELLLVCEDELFCTPRDEHETIKLKTVIRLAKRKNIFIEPPFTSKIARRNKEYID